jgi:hypothetical protein
MSSKKKTKTTTTNSYGWQQNPGSADIDALRKQVGSSFDTPDPSIAYNFGAQRNKMMDRYQNPFGADYSPEVNDAVKYSGQNELDQMQGQAYREDAFNRKSGKINAMGSLAALTGPQLTQTGGTSNTVQSTPMWGQILGAGAGIGQAALM